MDAPIHQCTFGAELWEHDGPGAWCFVSLPDDDADDVEELTRHRTRGFGSVRVEVRVGSTTWCTSLFPDSKRRTYVLPVKKAVRAAEGWDIGDRREVELRLID